MKGLNLKGKGKVQVHPLVLKNCTIKLLPSSHGVGIPFIASFLNLLSFPVNFFFFELLFPVKTFQLLRGRGKKIVQTIQLSLL